MSTAREQLKMIEEKLTRVRAEIERLKAQEEILVDLQKQMKGETKPRVRQRSRPIKPLVLDIMQNAGFAGATSADVDEMVRVEVPTVAKDTVGSVLSRLKGDGALVYDGERYYVKEYAPKPSPHDGAQIRAVN